MIEKGRLFLLLVGLALLLNVAPAFGQCTWCAGTWTDDGGHVWTLTQGTQTTNPSISGNVDTYPSACLVEQWPVDGAFQADGSFYVTATNPVPGDPYCVDWIQYQGTNRTPGCDTGSGNWIASDFTSGPWSWTKPCDTPNGETTTFAGWNASVGQWVQTLLPNDVNRFGGRTVQETDPGGGGPDTCWFQGSQLPPAVSISGGSWTVSAPNNGWGPDGVGWLPSAVSYYRSQNRAPCGTQVPQRMIITCSFSSPSYINNILTGSIGVTTVSSGRNGQTQTTTY